MSLGTLVRRHAAQPSRSRAADRRRSRGRDVPLLLPALDRHEPGLGREGVGVEPHRHEQRRQPLPVAARVLRRRHHVRDPRGRVGEQAHVVRRPLPGPGATSSRSSAAIADTILRQYPELVLPPDGEGGLHRRTAAAPSSASGWRRSTASRSGDTVPLIGTIYPRAGRLRVAVQHPRHLPLHARQRGRDDDVLPLALPRRGPREGEAGGPRGTSVYLHPAEGRLLGHGGQRTPSTATTPAARSARARSPRRPSRRTS